MPNKSNSDDMNVEWRSIPNPSNHIKHLEHQINHDQAQPVKPSEKRVRLETSFNDAIRQLSDKPSKGKR
jgi:hypothetical protein